MNVKTHGYWVFNNFFNSHSSQPYIVFMYIVGTYIIIQPLPKFGMIKSCESNIIKIHFNKCLPTLPIL